MSALSAADAKAFAGCVADGGVVVFPSDTVYGLACDPDSEPAAARLYELKGRPPAKPAAVMFFSLEAALEALSSPGARSTRALRALLPGPLTLLLQNPRGLFPPACGPDPGTLGLRVPSLGQRLASLSAIGAPVLQSSANLAGGTDPCVLNDVPASIRDGADLGLDGGELPGTPSTVVDLRAYEASGAWAIERAGAVTEEQIATALREVKSI